MNIPRFFQTTFHLPNSTNFLFSDRPLHPPYRRTSDLRPTISSRRPTSSTHPRPTNTTDDRRLTIAYRYFDLQPPTYYYDDDDDDDLRSTSDQPTDSTFRSPTDLLDRRPTTHQ
ncbi:hypothetical protein K445DRAFT_318376 [Daldinia sp. EC12]|nr:hypothetical protein K445DRAFT_318376 [Daldinia sp. EC12]